MLTVQQPDNAIKIAVSNKIMNRDTIAVALTENDFQKEVLESSLPVLVEFGADWCGSCHIMAPMIEDLFRNFRGQFKIAKLDIDKNERVAEQYGIQDLPTILFFKNGKLVNHIFGTVPKMVIEDKLKKLLNTEV